MESDKSSTLTTLIVAALRKRIIDGTLAPNVQVRQDHVAEEFGTSHVPVREAFRLLEAEGLLVARRHKGVRVASLDTDAVRETAMMRAALEVLALEQSLSRITGDDIMRARNAHANSETTQDVGVWIEENRKFHMALIQPCAMPRLLAAIAGLQLASERYLHAAFRDHDWQPRSCQEHMAILEFLEAGEGLRAAQLLGKHILAAGEALVDQFGAQPEV